MKKKIVSIVFLLVMFLTSISYALTVTYIGVNAFGGSYIAMQTQIPDMNRSDVIKILGAPTKSYGYMDVWVNHDQVYLGYYDIMGDPVSVVILPVTSW